MDTQDKPQSEKESKRLINGLSLKEVSDQLVEEFKVAEDHIRAWREKQRTFLKLYINQRKNVKKVGDTLMFSTHQTILAALYKDRLDAEWLWREEDDVDRAEMLNALYEFDYEEMGKAAHDFDKYWDTCFYGTSIEDWSHFDRESLTPIPDLWDPLNALFDPKATTINGNRLGRGAMRFGGREIIRTKLEMEDDSSFFDLSRLDTDEQKTTEMQKNEQARDTARGMESSWSDVKTNKYYPLRQWFTMLNGKRYLLEAGNEGKTIVRATLLKTDYWPLVESHIYPIPHSPIMSMPGCPDFTEDKQRARAILRNQTLEAAKLDVTPMWLFDKNKIKNKAQLKDWKAGKMIEGEGIDGNTMIPVTKPSIHQFVDNLMTEMASNAEKALATPEIQQGLLFAQKRTATEIDAATSGVDSRYGLTASLFSISEANGAYMWLDDYKRHFKDGIDKKSIRVNGPFGPKPEALTSDVFKFKKDPDVTIESRVVGQARKREQRNAMVAYGNLLLTTPGANLRYFAKKMGRLFFRKEEVERFMPPTLDEMRAEAENDTLSKNSLHGVVIEPTDDHKTHLEIHGKAKDTKAKMAHIEAHKKAMVEQRNRPELFAGMPGSPMMAGAPGAEQQRQPAADPQAALKQLLS